MPLSSFLAAAVQMTSTAERQRNLDTALRLVNEAADLGARLVGLPENFSFMGRDEERIAGAETVDGPTIAALRERARARRIFVLAGSIPDGAQYAESRTVEAGAEVVVAGTRLARVGLTICYDLRFPELYRALAA